MMIVMIIIIIIRGRKKQFLDIFLGNTFDKEHARNRGQNC
jgi:hypothetical protein